MTPIEISQAMSPMFDSATRACIAACQTSPGPSTVLIVAVFISGGLLISAILLCAWWSTRV